MTFKNYHSLLFELLPTYLKENPKIFDSFCHRVFGNPANAGVIENSIYPESSNVDFSYSITFDKLNEFQLLTKTHKQELLAEFGNHLFNMLSEFTDEWSESIALQNDVKNIWIEHDASQTGNQPPGLFIGPKAEACELFIHKYRWLDHFGWTMKEIEVCSKIFLWGEQKSIKPRFVQFGKMYSRKNSPAKLVYGPLSCQMADELITGVYGVSPFPKSLIKSFKNIQCNISINLPDKLECDVGLEFIALNNLEFTNYQEKLGDYLFRNTPISLNKYEDIISFSKRIQPHTNDVNWPLKMMLRSFDSKMFKPPILDFQINHLKLVFGNKVIKSVKSYLYYKIFRGNL